MLGWLSFAAISISRRKRSALRDAASSGRMTLSAASRPSLKITREIDRRHATMTQFPLDGVAVGEGGAKAVERIVP
jgi:hypothetical protein